MVYGGAPTSFRYRAFLSYSHRDEAAARRLHQALERYRVPRQLVDTPNVDGHPVPASLFPIFRDRDELSAAPSLPDTLHQALRDSENLIVLCSPASVHSRWVDQEILTFKRLGRSAKIHALVVDGDPLAPSGTEGACFAQALLTVVDVDGAVVEGVEANPIAADLRPEADGEALARLKIIAAILGVPFDALRRREAIAARGRRRRQFIIAGTIAVLALGVGLASWSALRFEDEADERQMPGVRMGDHLSTLDLTGWKPTTDADLASYLKTSSAVATDSYTLIKTQEFAANYVHVIGTTSDIPPDVSCEGCKVVDRRHDGASRTSHEFRLIFDISKIGLEEAYPVKYTTTYWNAFQTPSQWWGGVRISDLTEQVRFDVIFPAGKCPRRDTLKFTYFDIKSHPFTAKLDLTTALAPTDPARICRLSWHISNPLTDRSYRIAWDWSR